MSERNATPDEIAGMVHLRDRLRSGDIWVAGSRAFRAFDDFLLPSGVFALRRRSNAGLNKGEARNALARTLFFHRHGEIRERTFEKLISSFYRFVTISFARLSWTAAVDRMFALCEHPGMKLIIETDALKVLLKLPKADSRALREKLKTFAADPGGQHPWAKNFGGGKGRVRHGDWRSLYEVDGGAVTVAVVKVGHRREIYR